MINKEVYNKVIYNKIKEEVFKYLATKFKKEVDFKEVEDLKSCLETPLGDYMLFYDNDSDLIYIELIKTDGSNGGIVAEFDETTTEEEINKILKALKEELEEKIIEDEEDYNDEGGE